MEQIRCIENFEEFNLEKDGTVKVHIPKISLLPGQYTLDLAIESDNATPVDYYKECYKFEIFSKLSDVGVARLEHTWEGI